MLGAGARIGVGGALLAAGTTPGSASEPVDSLAGIGVRAPVDPSAGVADRFETPGRPSRTAYRALADVERQGQRSGLPGFDRVADATEYLDLGPDQPVDEALERADETGDLDGVRLHFPPGTYRIADECTVRPDGAFGIVAPDATFRIDADTRCGLNVTGIEYGLFEGLEFDQRAANAAIGLTVSTTGHVAVAGLTYRGPVEALDDGQPPLLRPVAANREASVRIDDFHALGGTNAGSHEWVGEGPPPEEHVAGGVAGAFVGPANEGVVQFVNPRLRGCGRTRCTPRGPPVRSR